MNTYNKEINKFRNAYNDSGLNKQKMLKWLKSFNPKCFDNNEIVKELTGKVDYLKEYPNDFIIQSNKEFKIFPKAKLIKTETLDTTINDNNKIELASTVTEGLVDEKGFNIECKLTRKPEVFELNEDLMADKYEPNETAEESKNVQVKDLQTLLIMMAMTSKTDETAHSNIIIEENGDVEVKEDNQRDTLTLPSHTLKTDDIENILNVSPLKIVLHDKNEKLISKYVKKWKDYVNKRKEYITQQRRETLNNFIDKLAKKKKDLEKHKSLVPHKVNLVAKDCGTYQHRYKMQKHIIALQKAKLEEQNRLIEELKYNKIVEASRESVDTLKDEVRRTYFEINRHLKPKIKCLTNELKIPEIDETSLVLHCLKVPQFLQRMEKRAREREEKHAMIRERRRQMEEERIRMKQQAELAKAEMDKEEKMTRIKELKEKRKREKIENIRRKQFSERLRALTVMADLHYEKYLMAKYGISPLRKLIEIKRANEAKAIAHYQFQLKKNVFLHLMWYTEDMWFERTYKAVEFYRKTILRKVFAAFKMNHYDYVLKKQVADDYYDLYVTQTAFRNLRKYTQMSKRENELKMQKAVSYYNWNIIFKAFTCWRTLPALNALQREQDARKARWRQKVLQVVPDYTPPDD